MRAVGGEREQGVGVECKSQAVELTLSVVILWHMKCGFLW